MDTVFCPYCTQPFERPARRFSWQDEGRLTCGQQICRSRTTSWNAWVRREQLRVVSGSVTRPAPKARPLPPFSAKALPLFDELVESFEPTYELEEAA